MNSIIFYPSEDKIVEIISTKLKIYGEEDNKGQIAGIEAEKKVFEFLKNSEFLRENNYRVFWSVPIDNHAGEIDFILLGKYGICVVEVKSGKWQFEGVRWYKRNYKSKRSPHEQAKDNAHKLIEYINKEYRNFPKPFVYNFVMFPQTFIDEIYYGFPRLVTIIGNHFSDQKAFDEALKEIIIEEGERWYNLKNLNRNRNLSLQEIERISHLITGHLKEKGKYISIRKIREYEDFLTTATQNRALEFFKYNHRMLLEGAAGSGKTIILTEFIRRYSPKNKVLFLCYNRNLMNKVRKDINNVDIHIYNLDSFMKKIFLDNKRCTKDEWSNDIVYDEEKKWRMLDEFLYDESMQDFINKNKYDMIFIDEAQDILKNEIIIDFMDKFLSGGIAAGKWIVAYDENQSIYLEEDEKEAFNSILDAFSYYGCMIKLDTIVRTPQVVVDEYGNRLNNIDIPLSLVSGGDVGVIKIDSVNQIYDKIMEKINEITEKVQDNKIGKTVLLTDSGKSVKGLLDNFPDKFCKIDKYEKGKIIVSTVHSYKGLEADNVFLFFNKEFDDKLFYVGFSRSRYSCYLLKLSENTREENNDEIYNIHEEDNSDELINIDKLYSISQKTTEALLTDDIKISIGGSVYIIEKASSWKEIKAFCECMKNNKNECIVVMLDEYANHKVVLKNKEGRRLEGVKIRKG